MSKRSLPEMPEKKILLVGGIVLVIVALGVLQPILWPGGFGIAKEQSVTTKSAVGATKVARRLSAQSPWPSSPEDKTAAY
jgi:hypothetical protein